MTVELREPNVAPGPPGPQGPPGVDGPQPFVFTQSSQSTMWHIVHGLGSNPSVAVKRDDGVTIGGFGIIYVDLNVTDLYFGQPVRGVATCNA